ncbi:hypothetical protein BsWGS_08000 [Bradybaena similaris]
MKRTIKSYFGLTTAESGKKPREELPQPTVLQTTDIRNVENECSGISKLHSVKSSHKEERHYNKHWEEKYSWLEYSEGKGGAFCKLCKNYMKNDAKVLQKSGGTFITVPFTCFKKALGKDGKLEKHDHSSAHTVSVQMETLRMQAMKKPIHTQIIQQSESERDLNRKGLKTLLRGLYFLVKEEVAHTTKYESLIESILDQLSDDFKTWRHALSDRSNYSSKDTASELLVCMGEVLRGDLKKTLKNKKFSILADESTSLRNEMELSVMFRVMEDNVPMEKFLALVKIPNGKAETIANAIDKELTSLDLNYENIIAFGFDGASNMAGNVGGVRKKLSEKANKEVLYVHCRAHILSLAAASCRNKSQKVKRFFHVLKDIYKLFSKSPKKEHILHEIQAVINDPILKIPECIEVRWLSHHRIVNAIFRSLKSILMACEHIHKEGEDLASLAGGILLEIRNESFIITCHVMNELLSALAYLSTALQKKDLRLSKVIPLITTTKLHLRDIVRQCEQIDGDLQKNVRCKIMEIRSEVHLIADEDTKRIFTIMKEYCESVVKEIEDRFNDKSIDIMIFASRFETFRSLLDLQDTEVRKFCDNFPILNAEGVLADMKSFKFFIKSMYESGTYKEDESPLAKIMEADVGYCELQKLCEILLVIPVTTASVERSFSAMNRILCKARNRMLPGTLMHCMMISIEGPEIPTDEFLERTVDLYAMTKPRRLRFL